MKHSLHIAALLDSPGVLKNLVEQLAARKNDLGYSTQNVPLGQEALETASAPVYTTGAVLMQEGGEKLNIPFITSFMFTCVKSINGHYQLAWSSSLS
ncbi:MAG: hypothetical protein QM725_08450 [Lacibacter sp.]